MAASARDAGRVVSVFGGSRATEDSPEFRDAYELGRLLAERGYAVCNGGYDGTMAAVSRGAKDGGGRTIGVTVEALSWRSPNRWIDEEVSTASLFARLEQLPHLPAAWPLVDEVACGRRIAVRWRLTNVLRSTRRR